MKRILIYLRHHLLCPLQGYRPQGHIVLLEGGGWDFDYRCSNCQRRMWTDGVDDEP